MYFDLRTKLENLKKNGQKHNENMFSNMIQFSQTMYH